MSYNDSNVTKYHGTPVSEAYRIQSDLGQIITAQSLDASKTTDALEIVGMKNVQVGCKLTRDSATEVQLVAEVALVETTPVAADWYEVQFVDDGTSPNHQTLKAVWRHVVGSSHNWVWEIPVNAHWVRFVFTSTAGTASDVLNAYAIAST